MSQKDKAMFSWSSKVNIEQKEEPKRKVKDKTMFSWSSKVNIER